MTEYESAHACYVFAPDERNGLPKRPSKRRKTGRAPESASDDIDLLFASLLRGTESAQSAQTRELNYNEMWRPKEALIDETVRLASDDTVNQIVSYVVAQDFVESKGKLPTGLIAAGPDNNTSLHLPSVAERVSLEERALLIELSSGQCPNLKSTLKYINQHATSQVVADDEEMAMIDKKQGRRLNYDLEILHDYTYAHSIRKVIIAFQDSEAFEAALVAELIEVLSSWGDRIPFVLLFSIATSIELFQAKLPKESIGRLAGAEFGLKHIDFDEIFQAIHYDDSAVYFGPAISSRILQQQRDFIQSPAAVAQTLKYVYMTHFFANPLSVLLCDVPTAAPLQKEHYEAIRNIPSFRRYAQSLIDESDYEFVRDLLDDDESLNEAVMREITNSRKAMKDVLMGLRVLHRLQSCHTRISYAPWSELYIQAMSGSLLQSAIFNDILNSIKKLPSNTMDNVLSLPAAIPSPSSDIVLDLTAINTDLKQITGSMDPNALPLRSAYDIQNSALRTTVVAQKVSLSMSSAKMSSQDNAYTKIVDRTYNALLKYFQTTLINPSDLFLSEILIYDSKSPLRDAFTPRPRFAIERALSSPHDYLGCECCSSGEGAGLQSSLPATAILYQLYLESGSVINTADLWEAFWTVTGGEDDDEERSEALALFSRALAELKYMGMIKNSRKKADHLQKLAWKGL